MGVHGRGAHAMEVRGQLTGGVGSFYHVNPGV